MKSVETIWGTHAVAAALECHPEAVLELWLQQPEGPSEALEVSATALGISVQRVSSSALDRVAGRAHQGVAARYRPPLPLDQKQLLEMLATGSSSALLLVLDGVTDPGNLGACLRSAEAFGVTALVVPRERSAALTGAARKAACGSAERVPMARVANLARCLSALADTGIITVGMVAETAETAGRLADCDLTGPLALVLGAEDRGLRHLTRERCQQLAGVPLAGVIPSLNVAACCAVALYETARQRGFWPAREPLS